MGEWYGDVFEMNGYGNMKEGAENEVEAGEEGEHRVNRGLRREQRG